MSRISRIALATTVVLAGWLTACDKSPTRPSDQSTQSTSSPPPPPSLQRIKIEGPALVLPGTHAQYSAFGQISDGTTKDLTSTVTWRSSDDGVLAISPSGEATGGRLGEVTLAVESSGKRDGIQVLVLAPGTFRVMGVVSDNGVPIVGATVDVLDGSRAVMSAVTDEQGLYRLYGLSGFVELRVRATGYSEQIRAFPVNDEVKYDFALPPNADLRGPYQLTISVDPASCPASSRNALPAELRVRTYDAAITQTGSILSVRLSGGSLTSGSFSGTVIGGIATFDIRGLNSSSYYYYTYFDRTLDLVEQVPTGFLIISGKATASTVSTGLSGTLQGVMGVVPTLSGYPVLNSVCYGKKRFVLTRR